MKVTWTVAAQDDRNAIADHIAAENPRAAASMDQLFSDAAARLGDFPMIGYAGAIQGTREFIPHESYRIVYEVDSDMVWVLALVHTSRRWPPVSA